MFRIHLADHLGQVRRRRRDAGLRLQEGVGLQVEPLREITPAHVVGDDLGARERRVYLPAGAEWTHVDTGRRYAGGAQVDIAAPLDSIPVLVRDESQLPLKMEVQ